MIIASTSTLHGSTYLNYLKNELITHFSEASSIVFIPYARPGGISHDEYTTIAKRFFETINIDIKGLHTFNDPVEGLLNSKGIFVGGGNTFVLVNALYTNKLLSTIRSRVLQGVPYLGTSAGSNITGMTMQTTNDMPIVYPPSFDTLGLVPFNINPHYLDPVTGSKHMGETRETRIKEFHKFNTLPVIGLREGSWLHVVNETITLKGNLKARVFEAEVSPYEIEPNTVLNL